MPLCLVGQFSPFTGGAQQTLFGARIASFVGLFFSLIGASPILFGSCHGRSRHSQVAPLKGPRTTAQALFHPGQREDPSRATTTTNSVSVRSICAARSKIAPTRHHRRLALHGHLVRLPNRDANQ